MAQRPEEKNLDFLKDMDRDLALRIMERLPEADRERAFLTRFAAPEIPRETDEQAYAREARERERNQAAGAGQ